MCSDYNLRRYYVTVTRKKKMTHSTKEWEPMLGGSDLAPSLEVVWKVRP